MSKLLQELNPEQRRAVETVQGPLLVLAGAGTGKTRVITYRVAHMLAQGIRSGNVLAVTFTNKAASEMRERLVDLVGKRRAEGLVVGTFHSFCLRLLREHLDALGMPKGFTICDPGDQLSLVKGALRELRVAEARMKPQEALARISLAKNRLEGPAQLARRVGGDEGELLHRVFERYRDGLRRSRRLDFDDLLVETVRVLKDPVVLERVRERHRYVLVDEYQDTNSPQFEIVRALSAEHRNLCVVGDDDQSIYGWRGADVQKILDFPKLFPEAVVVKLETNYRSTEQILKCANKLIAINPQRHPKELRSAFGPGEPIQAVTMRDEDTEAELVVREILRMQAAGHHLDEFAILFRTAVQARPFEAELRAREVPYSLVGGLSFFDRKEVRDVLSYLRLLVHPDDETALLRVVNCPPRGVGPKTIDRLIEFATEHGISVAKAMDKAEKGQVEGVSPDRVAAVQRMRERLATLRQLYPDSKSNLVPLIRETIEHVGYTTEVERLYKEKEEREKRWEGVLEVLNYAENFAKKRKRPRLADFLNALSLQSSDRESAEDAATRLTVTLMTLHASKGLEFKRVFLVGLEEGVLPHHRAAKEDSIEEERRLAYVGITRAQRFLQLSWCAHRARAGQRVQRHPSRFLLELQDKAPPADWIPAGDEDPTGNKRKKKAKGAKRARRARR